MTRIFSASPRGADLKVQQCVDLALQNGHSLQQLLYRHGPHRPFGPAAAETVQNQGHRRSPCVFETGTWWAKRFNSVRLTRRDAKGPDSPFLHSDKVERHLSVGKGLLVQVAAVASDERRHVVACRAHGRRSTSAQSQHL